MTRFGSDWLLIERLRDEYGLAAHFGVTVLTATPRQKNSAEIETPISHQRISVQIFMASANYVTLVYPADNSENYT